MIKINEQNYKLLGLAALLLSHTCFALSTDHNAPVYISADSANINQQTGKGVYKGNVTVDQGSSHLAAAIAYTYSNKDNSLTKAIAKGNGTKLAHFLTKVDVDKPDLNATADKITYLPNEHKIILQGHARVTHGADSYSAPEIEYDTKAQHVISKVNPIGRTTIIIHPKQREKTA